MDCAQARDWLLRSDDPRPECSGLPELIEHTRRCGECGRLAEELQQLEQAWRELPVPAGADRARTAFLITVGRRPPPRLRFLRRLVPPRWAVAALIVLSAGLATWLFFPGSEAHASADVVERLIDWNLHLAETRSLDERNRIYAEEATKFRAALHQAELSPEDRELGRLLLDNGTWLARNDDPLAEADRFDEVANRLLQRVDSAAAHEREQEVSRVAEQYHRVAELGVGASLERVKSDPGLGADRKRHLDKLARREAKRAQALQALLERGPDASRRAIRRVLEAPRKHAWPKGHGGKKAGRKGGRKGKAAPGEQE